MKFVLDEEINLIKSSDFLNTKVYVDNLKAVIENYQSNENYHELITQVISHVEEISEEKKTTNNE